MSMAFRLTTIYGKDYVIAEFHTLAIAGICVAVSSPVLPCQFPQICRSSGVVNGFQRTSPCF